MPHFNLCMPFLCCLHSSIVFIQKMYNCFQNKFVSNYSTINHHFYLSFLSCRSQQILSEESLIFRKLISPIIFVHCILNFFEWGHFYHSPSPYFDKPYRDKKQNCLRWHRFFHVNKYVHFSNRSNIMNCCR